MWGSGGEPGDVSVRLHGREGVGIHDHHGHETPDSHGLFQTYDLTLSIERSRVLS